MTKPAAGNGGRGRERRQESLADDANVCPLACIAHHTEPLTNRRGEVRATECALCLQIVARSMWDDLLTGRIREAP